MIDNELYHYITNHDAWVREHAPGWVDRLFAQPTREDQVATWKLYEQIASPEMKAELRRLIAERKQAAG